MNTMEEFLHKRVLAIYWIVLALNCVFLYFDLPYIYITEPLLVPLLLLYLFLNDNNIGKPAGKFIFYIGLFLAFLGDTMQIVINNDVFFLSSLVAFMLMNICYSICFFSLHKKGVRKPLPLLITCTIIFLLGYCFIDFLGGEMGDYKMPVIMYACTLCIMIALAVNVTRNKLYHQTALKYLLPGSVIFLMQNLILAMNLFHFGGHNQLYVFSIVPYGIAQYLMAKGILKVYS